MKVKKFTCGITFFVTPEMYRDLKQLSDEKQVAISELLRDWIAEGFERGKCQSEGLPDDTGELETKGKDKQDGKFIRSGSV